MFAATVSYLPYLIFTFYMLGVGALLASGFNFYEDGLTLQVGLYFLIAIVLILLATIGTINIILSPY